MRNRTLAAAGGLVLACAVAVLSLGLTAAGATAPAGTLGTLTMTPATGLDVLAPKVRTSAGCPSTADGYNAYVSGPGAFAVGYLITGTGDAGFSTTSPFDVQFGVSMKDAATDLSTTLVAGTYPVTVNCVDSFSLEVKGTFTGAMYFTSPTQYQSTDPNGPTSATTTAGSTTATTSTAVTTTAASTTTVAPTTTATSAPVTSSVNGGGQTLAVSVNSSSTVDPAPPAPAAAAPPKLANTGPDLWYLLMAAIALLVVGVLLVTLAQPTSRRV